MKAFLLVFMIVSSALAQEKTARVTLFREGQNQLSQFKGDYAGYGARWPIYMDGRKLVILHRDRMVVFTVPSGHHEFKTEKSELLALDLAPGDSLFIRPVVGSKNHGFAASIRLEKVSCSDFTGRATEIQQAKPEDIFSGDHVQAASFSEVCKPRQ
jgi:hypothetical protein